VAESSTPRATIYCDPTVAAEFLGAIQTLECEIQPLPLKGAHFLIPPDFAIYRWETRKNLKLVMDEIETFRRAYPRRLILVEGEPDDDHAVVVAGLQMRLWLDYGDLMQPARDFAATSMILKSLAVRLQIKDHPPVISRPKPAEDSTTRQINLLQGLVGIGPNKAERLLSHFDSAWNVLAAVDENPDAIAELKGFGLAGTQVYRELLLVEKFEE
jgi:ERCC4-type nuclease